MKDSELLKKSLVLNLNAQGFIYKYIKNSNMRSMYKNIDNKFLRALSKIWLKFYIPGKSYFFGNWKKEIEKVNQVVIFDNGYRTELSRYIKSKKKECKIIVFCWNTLDVKSPILTQQKYIDKIYSFDPGDIEKYGFKFNNSFYTKDLILKKQPTKYDLFFLGLDKGRKEKLNKIKEQCHKSNISYNFKIIKSKEDYIDYDEYLQLLNKSKAVLDITRTGQRGLTVRAMECLFLGKKLITDNKEIKNYSLYKKNNIFILGEDNINELKKFIETPYEKPEQKIIDEYDYKNWCLRMLKGEEQKH